eukprot:TRINITY_DN2186_c0_g1_i7.p1 TRINITY_DN2186_c0_g1~~TRINITY_DN2186_c0_g1_i7.p1  ORF type:complete len:295 (+),score=15.07 TRINITY_DN2186_c0_g1_i7:254-1138(+)
MLLRANGLCRYRAASKSARCSAQGSNDRQIPLHLHDGHAIMLPHKPFELLLYGPPMDDGQGFVMQTVRCHHQSEGLVPYKAPTPPVYSVDGLQEFQVVLYEGRKGVVSITMYGRPVSGSEAAPSKAIIGLLPPPQTAGALPCPSQSTENDVESAKEEGEEALFLGTQRSPRRTLRLSFTCNRCGTRNVNQVNPLAWFSGAVFIQCGGCHVKHKMVDHLNIVQEMSAPVNDRQLALDQLRKMMPTHMLPISSPQIHHDAYAHAAHQFTVGCLRSRSVHVHLRSRACYAVGAGRVS